MTGRPSAGGRNRSGRYQPAHGGAGRGILDDAELAIPPSGSKAAPAVRVTIPAPPAGHGSQSQPVEETSATSLSDVYEPGSPNELITVSAALQPGEIGPSDVFALPDSYTVAGAVFHHAEPHPTEHWTVTDISAKSSDVGTTEVTQTLGRADLTATGAAEVAGTPLPGLPLPGLPLPGLPLPGLPLPGLTVSVPVPPRGFTSG